MGLVHTGKVVLQDHFVGWISLNSDYCTDMKKMALNLNQIFQAYQGPLFSHYVYSMEYFEEGIVFTSKLISDAEATDFYIQQLRAHDFIEDEKKEATMQDLKQQIVQSDWYVSKPLHDWYDAYDILDDDVEGCD